MVYLNDSYALFYTSIDLDRNLKPSGVLCLQRWHESQECPHSFGLEMRPICLKLCGERLTSFAAILGFTFIYLNLKEA